MELYKVKITLLTSSGYAVHIVQVTFVQRLSLRFSNFKVEQTLSEGVGVSSIVQHHIVTVHLHSTFIHIPGNQCVCVCPRITLNTNLRQTPTLGTEVPVVSSFGWDSLLVLSGVRPCGATLKQAGELPQCLGDTTLWKGTTYLVINRLLFAELAACKVAAVFPTLPQVPPDKVTSLVAKSFKTHWETHERLYI